MKIIFTLVQVLALATTSFAGPTKVVCVNGQCGRVYGTKQQLIAKIQQDVSRNRERDRKAFTAKLQLVKRCK